MEPEIFVAYMSPNGSTRVVGETLKETFLRLKRAVSVLDLADSSRIPPFMEAIERAGDRACLVVGAPVYGFVAVPPVMAFIDRLPDMTGAFAVPYITWGKVTSGAALWQMGKALMKKRCRIAGAAKVLALHSMVWWADHPPGEGHPDKADKRKLEELAEILDARFGSPPVPCLSLDALDYQPPEKAGDMKKRIGVVRKPVQKDVDREACTRCGLCSEVCPVAAVNLNPYPEFGPACFDCLNCIRLCPEGAITPARRLAEVESNIRRLMRKYDERPFTQIFV